MTSEKWLQKSNAWYNTYTQNFVDGAQKCDTTKLLDSFLNLLPKEGTVLDVGCGSGRDLSYMVQKNFSAEGLEPSENLAEIAKFHSGCHIYVSDILHLPQKMWDGIWCLAVFVHIPLHQWQITIETLLSRLSPNGYLHLETKNGETSETIDSLGRPLSLISKKDLETCLSVFQKTCNIVINTNIASTSQGHEVKWHSIRIQKCAHS
jgi:2-polyprenyl-3-methyl-5-hydroxy-6-metoxy-1,4-benzoquinol methylase